MSTVTIKNQGTGVEHTVLKSDTIASDVGAVPTNSTDGSSVATLINTLGSVGFASYDNSGSASVNAYGAELHLSGSPLFANGNILSGTNTGNETAASIGTLIGGSAVLDNTTIDDADLVPISDTSAAGILKNTTWTSIKTFLGLTFAQLAGSVSQAFSTANLTVAGKEVITTIAGNQNGLQITGLLDGAAGATARGLFINPTYQPNATSSIVNLNSIPTTAAGAWSTNFYTGIASGLGTIGVGHTIVSIDGFSAAANLGAKATTVCTGFRSSIAASAVDWNFYAGGTARNYFAGNLQLGSTTATSGAEKLQVTGSINVSSKILINSKLDIGAHIHLFNSFMGVI
jgi:hypothetical protein